MIKIAFLVKKVVAGTILVKKVVAGTFLVKKVVAGTILVKKVVAGTILVKKVVAGAISVNKSVQKRSRSHFSPKTRCLPSTQIKSDDCRCVGLRYLAGVVT